MRKASEGLEFT
jgi:hypothetical protein